ncbi:MAG: serine/threonine protein kinase [Firmicutes bacterium]|nr:serine/threonine protein kinase [Bacillota bacterium]
MAALNQILSGKYRLVKLLGRGGMSTVYLAEDLTLGKEWAVKELDTSRPEYRRLLEKDGTLAEIEILKALDHPLAPRLVDRFEEGGMIYLVMDRIEGEDLQSVINRTGPQDPATAAAWMEDVCSLLSYLHDNGIVYRDLKPQNLILSRDGRIRMVDLGFPTKIVRNGDHRDDVPFGTPGYAAPEQARGFSDARSDVYAAGVTMYQLLTGESPGKKRFRPKPLGSVRPGTPPGLAAVCARAVKERPRDRFQSMTEMLDAIRNYAKAEKPYIEKLRLKMAVSRWILAAGLALFLAGGLFAEGFYLRDLSVYERLAAAGNEESLLRAFSVMPYRTEALASLAELYRKDGLTKEEQDALAGLFASHLENTPFAGDDTGVLAFTIASAVISSSQAPFADCLSRVGLALPLLREASASRSCGAQASALVSLYDAAAGSPEKDALRVGLEAAASVALSRDRFIGPGSADAVLASEKAVLEFLEIRAGDIEKAGFVKAARTVLAMAGDGIAQVREYGDPEKLLAADAGLSALLERFGGEKEAGQ